MTMPAHAPYENVEVGHEVEIRVRRGDGDEDTLIAECEFRGDTFGAQTSLGSNDLERVLAIDELVSGVAMLVWNELLGTPVFREEDQEWVGRVEARRHWQATERKPTMGWVRVHADIPPSPDPERERDAVAAHLGDADVSELRLSQEEMAALTRGEIPASLTEKLLRARSTENLIESALAACEALASGDAEMLRVASELTEVRRRFNGA